MSGACHSKLNDEESELRDSHTKWPRARRKQRPTNSIYGVYWITRALSSQVIFSVNARYDSVDYN